MKKVLIILFVMILPLFAVAQTAEECFNRGEDFYYGKNGVTKNDKEAIKWYQKAADQGDARAQNMLGTLYVNGEGVPEDVIKAVEWFQKAANQGNTRAQCYLGEMYYYGFGVSQDYGKAVEWYQKAADQGDADAQINLGEMYYYGKGILKDFAKAAKLFQKAANQGDATAQCNLGFMYEKGFGVSKDYNKALEWFQKAADQGNAMAQNNLGDMYENGEGVSKDYDKALEWYKKSADQGFGFAFVSIGHMYEEGLGVPKDYKKAEELYRKAIAENEDRAESFLHHLQVRIEKEKNEGSQISNDSQNETLMNESTDNVNLIDTNIPTGKQVNNNLFVIIIANENYQNETKVDYAKNDGETFKKYCNKTLRIPENHIHYASDATLNNLIGELDWLQQVCEAYSGNASVIFYYAGHGIPDESSGAAYLLPIDGNSRILRTCLSVEELYNILGKMPAKKVTVLMDACFSGAVRNGGMLTAARGVAIKAKTNNPVGNMIVLSAAQGNETAYKYEEAHHGLFTYFLLKKLRESQGSANLGELSNYITEQVKRHSTIVNGKSQTPSVLVSNKLDSSWEEMKLY